MRTYLGSFNLPTELEPELSELTRRQFELLGYRETPELESTVEATHAAEVVHDLFRDLMSASTRWEELRPLFRLLEARDEAVAMDALADWCAAVDVELKRFHDRTAIELPDDGPRVNGADEARDEAREADSDPSARGGMVNAAGEVSIPWVVCPDPYDEPSFVAGMHLGEIRSILELGSLGANVQRIVPKGLVPQIDILAMAYGSRIVDMPSGIPGAVVVLIGSGDGSPA